MVSQIIASSSSASATRERKYPSENKLPDKENLVLECNDSRCRKTPFPLECPPSFWIVLRFAVFQRTPQDHSKQACMRVSNDLCIRFDEILSTMNMLVIYRKRLLKKCEPKKQRFAYNSRQALENSMQFHRQV